MDHGPPAWDAETEHAGERESGRVLRRQVLVVLIVWTLAIFASLAWNLHQSEHQMMAHAHKEALANFNKDQAFRFWATKHGGVYVPATAETPPSPYLAHIPERDVVTPSGQVLTLLNPNYMVREMQEEYRERYGIRGHITGLRLLRPENAPDAWERRALEAFERGTEEVVDRAVLDGEPFLRLMRPMVMEEGCVKCHGHLGYNIGDVRGGVGVAVPMRPYLETRRHTDTGLFAGHGVIWLLGVGLIGVGASQLRRRLGETLRAETDLRRLNLELEARVAQRTAALAEKEERLRMMVSTAADGILTADGSGTIESVNAAAATIFGYAPEELAGQPIGLLTPPPHDRRHQNYIEADLWSGNSRVVGIGREVEGRRKDGTVFPLHIAVGAARLENRTLFTAVLRDLTAQKRAEAELMAAKELAEAARRQAEAANRAKSQFLASMSHELRTPINAVLGFAQLLDRGIAGELSDKQREYVRIILTAGNHLLQLIGDVLDLAKIEAGKVDLSLEAVRPAEVVAECLGLMAPLAQKMGVTIDDRVTGCPEAAEVRADYVRLKQILVNLVSNGIKYNRPGGRVVISCQAGAPGMQRLVVEDNGRGIAGERLSDLFQPFNRLGAEVGTVEGTGIGLTITRRLVELMAGRIEVESEPGAGSRFTVEMPVASAEERRHGRGSPVAASPSALAIAGGRHTILYVEDNPLNVELVREMLGLFANITFLSAPTAEAGIAIARTDHPDLILMDINLPGIDGFEALRRLRTHEATRLIPAIALSATAMPQDIRRGREAGFSSYLVKPLDVARTIEAINVALDSGAPGSPDPARRP